MFKQSASSIGTRIPFAENVARELTGPGCFAATVQEGSQFCRGFGGIGGLLRYSVDLSQFEVQEEEDGPEWDSDEDI